MVLLHKLKENAKTRCFAAVCLLLAVTALLLPVEAQAASVSDFADVSSGAWYYSAVSYVTSKGLFNGTGNGKFSPNDSMTRDMIVTVLWRLDGEPKADEPASFTDIAADKWYADAVAWGQANDIVNGIGHDLFAPGQEVTREQIAAMLYRYAKFKGYDVSVGEDTNIISFNDYDQTSKWAVPAMQWAVGAGIINGDSKGNLNSTASATRAEVATMLQRFIAFAEG